MKKILFFLTLFSLGLTGLTINMSALAMVDANKVFTDITASHLNKEAIDYMQQSGIVKGYDDGSFKPDQKINRVEFLKIVLEANANFSLKVAQDCVSAKTGIGMKTIYLTDVPADQWFAPYVCYGIEENIVKGYPDGTFKPTQEINLPEMAKIIANTQNLTVAPIKTGEEWYEPFITVLETNKAIPTTMITIDHKVTRGEMAESLFRILSKRTNKASNNLQSLKAGKAPVTEEASVNIIKNGLGQVASCSQLTTIMQESEDYSHRMYMEKMKVMEESVSNTAADMDTAESLPTPTAAPFELKTGGGSDAPDNFSSTNIQVAGVDEADIIKNDGKYIYVIKDNSIRVIEAYPADKMKEISAFTLDDNSFQPTEMFLNGNQLVIIGNSYREEVPQTTTKSNAKLLPMPYFPHYWSTELTRVYLIDLTDHAKPKITRTVTYEGYYSNSRRVGNIAYLIINKTPDYFIMREDNLDAEKIIPQVEDSAFKSSASAPACKCADIRYFPGYERPNYMIVSAIPLDDLTKEVTKKVYLGSSENVYMSTKALYIATGAPDEKGGYWNYDNTQIYKFDLDKTNIEFNKTNKVTGRILNQFSMDEYQDNFRIATTKGEVWGDEKNKSSNRLYVLDKSLKQVGAIEDIAPGERIYSVRFMGDRAFMVTFKTVDPLFVIDLKDPTKPQILGQLKIPGWSDYLHPYDANHLIGFGKEVDESIDKDKVHSEDAVYYTAVQGMKMSLFDVTDVTNPKEMFKEVIGARGTDSELLYNHKALLFDKEKSILAFPVEVQEQIVTKDLVCGKYRYDACPSGCEQRCVPTCTENSDGVAECKDDCNGLGSCQNSNYEQFKTTFVGAYVYNIDLEKGFKLKGKIASLTEKELANQERYFYTPWEKKIQRVIYIAENLYAISQSFVKAVTMSEVKPVTEIEYKAETSPLSGLKTEEKVKTTSTKDCPKFINCMPQIGKTLDCTIPKGCEDITEVVY